MSAMIKYNANCSNKNINLGTMDHSPTVFCIFYDTSPTSYSQHNNSIFHAAFNENSKNSKNLLINALEC